MMVKKVNILIICCCLYIFSIIFYSDDPLFFYINRVPYLYLSPFIFFELYKLGKIIQNPNFVLRTSGVNNLILVAVYNILIFVFSIIIPVLISGHINLEIFISFLFIFEVYISALLWLLLLMFVAKLSISFLIILVLFISWYFALFLFLGFNTFYLYETIKYIFINGVLIAVLSGMLNIIYKKRGSLC